MSKWLPILLLVLIAILAGMWLTGCGDGVLDADPSEPSARDGEGVFLAQIDSKTVQVAVQDKITEFSLGEGVEFATIPAGALIRYQYMEVNGEKVILSIDTFPEEDAVKQAEGIYNGQIDSRSVEIEHDGSPRAFVIGTQVDVEPIMPGSRIAYTYREEAHRPLLTSIEVLSEPEPAEVGLFSGEGILEGQIDSQSVSINLTRAFLLGQDMKIGDLAPGDGVAFSYRQEKTQAVLESLEKADVPPEGDRLHGTLVTVEGDVRVEIDYYQAFALPGDLSLEGIEDGAEIVFTYEEGAFRPLLLSIAPR